MSRLLALSLVVCLALAGCRSTQPASPSGPSPLQARVDSLQAVADSLERAASLRDPILYSTLWTQTAVEYDAVARGAFALAGTMMRRALEDSAWTAALEQQERGPEAYRDLPPAVVLDVDETVLDNSPYQARLIEDGTSYNTGSWHAWCREAQAEAVPGALAFTRAATAAGVQVIYLTNRDAEVEPATRKNLTALGFPVSDTLDVVLTQGEKPDWEEKGPRREWVADRFRILLLIGDNFGDFRSGVETTPSDRAALAQEHAAYWGARWIALPNAQYGSWDGALFDYNYGLPPLDRLDALHDHLETER